jgi:TonB family protein
LLRPVVLIPLGCLSGLSPTQVEAILAHELAHIRRHDYLVSVLQSVVEALLFYHPAVWWVSRHIRREREHCCDDLAVKFGGDALTYARALSLLEERRSVLPAIALGANGGILTMRIKRLLGLKQSPAASQLAALALLGIVIAATAVCIGTAARAQSSRTTQATPTLSTITVATEDIHGPALPRDNAEVPAAPALPQQPAVIPAMSIAYRRWIDQDVRWDATPAERAAFLQLTSDPERDHFIEQFWQRRNPPNAAPNAVRGEHYRRIAYANQHFAAGTTGWETDRGHIYIVYGQPDTIDAHGTNEASSHPYEVWRYSSAPGLGQNIELKFVDVCNCGNYQLQSQPTPTHNSSSTNPPRPSLPPARVAAKPAIRQVSYKAPIAVPQSQTPASSAPIHVSSHVMQTNIVSKVNPIYPPDAKTAHVQGAVVLDVIISKDGTVQALRVIRGPDELRTSALNAVRQWIFEPYLLNGEPTEVETTITINYQLDDPADSQLQSDESATGVVPKKIGGGVSTPVLIYSVPPEFSEQAKKDQVGGTVLIHLWVDEQGRPEHVRVLRGVGKGLDEKAVEAVRQYKFNPAMEGGRPVLVELNTEVNFKIF